MRDSKKHRINNHELEQIVIEEKVIPVCLLA